MRGLRRRQQWSDNDRQKCFHQMKIFPSYRFKIITPLSKDKVLHNLSSTVEPLEVFSFQQKGTSAFFAGEINNSGFSLVRRISKYERTQLPRVIGTISKDINGTIIEVVIEPQKFVMIFILLVSLFWIGMVVLDIVAGGFDSTEIIFMLIPIFIYVLAITNVKPESELAIKELERIFEGRIME